jgi:hypothetical protein
MSLVTSMRLSVQPVTDEEWAIVCGMGGIDPGNAEAGVGNPACPGVTVAARQAQLTESDCTRYA